MAGVSTSGPGRSGSSPGELEINADRAPGRARRADLHQHRRPADPGRLAHPPARREPRPGVRPGRRGRASGSTSRRAPRIRFEPGASRTAGIVALQGRRASGSPASRSCRRVDLMARIAPGGVRGDLRPDRRRPDPARRHRPVDRDRAGPHLRRRGVGLRRRQVDPRVDEPGAGHLGRRCAGHGDHQRGDPGPLGHRPRRRRDPGRAGSPASAAAATRTSPTGSIPTLVIGPGTDVISGEGKILTAGGFDSHVHFLSPSQIHEALAAGLTTLGGGGTGPVGGLQGHHGHPGRLAPEAGPPGARRVPGQPAAAGQGQHRVGGRLRGAGAGRGRRLQGARGLGLHPGGGRRRPEGAPRSGGCRSPCTRTR